MTTNKENPSSGVNLIEKLQNDLKKLIHTETF